MFIAFCNQIIFSSVKSEMLKANYVSLLMELKCFRDNADAINIRTPNGVFQNK